MVAFVRRIGGMIVAPQAVLAPYAQGGAREGGFNDLLALLLLQAVALQLPAVARAGWQMIDSNLLVGAMALLQVLAQMMLVPLAAALVGGVALRLLNPRALRLRHLDLAGLCAIPPLALQIAFSLLAVALPALYQGWVRTAVLVVSGLYFAVLIALAHRLVARLSTR